MRPRNHRRPTPPIHPLSSHHTLTGERPLSFSPFVASPAASLCPSLRFLCPSCASVLFQCLSLFLLLSSRSLHQAPRYPSLCLQQPYKPWSSAGASSFTRAMYPDVSEGRNFASVCVNRFCLSRSLSFPRFPILVSPSRFSLLPSFSPVLTFTLFPSPSPSHRRSLPSPVLLLHAPPFL